MTEFIEIFIRLFEQELSMHPSVILGTALIISSLGLLALLFHKRYKSIELKPSPALLS
ncbi:MAG: hypothetical protein AAF696_05070 [Bacteroidota bacterium]